MSIKNSSGRETSQKPRRVKKVGRRPEGTCLFQDLGSEIWGGLRAGIVFSEVLSRSCMENTITSNESPSCFGKLGAQKSLDQYTVPSIKVPNEGDIACQEPSLLEQLKRQLTLLATDRLGHPPPFEETEIGTQNGIVARWMVTRYTKSTGTLVEWEQLQGVLC